MIDFSREKLIPVLQVPLHLPPTVSGKPRHFTTIYRWCRVGVWGVKLPTVSVGGQLYCTYAGLNSFMEAMTAARERRLSSKEPAEVLTDAR